mgnify:CR=1 FL=1
MAKLLQAGAILDAAKARPIRHLMINTNGLLIAREPGFNGLIINAARGFLRRGLCHSVASDAHERGIHDDRLLR